MSKKEFIRGLIENNENVKEGIKNGIYKVENDILKVKDSTFGWVHSIYERWYADSQVGNVFVSVKKKNE